MDNEYCGLLEGELLDIVQGGGGTNNYPDLNELPSINGVTLVGNKSGEDLGLASESYVNTKVAELVGTAPEMLDTIGELATAVKENQDVIGALKVPTKTSELTNDSGFITADDIPQQEVDLTNYYTKSETESYVQGQNFATKDYIDGLVGNINTELENVLGV